MLLLAKDGIYLPIAPRAVVQGLLASGNRADLLINCPEGDFDFTSTQVGEYSSVEAVEEPNVQGPFGVIKDTLLFIRAEVSPGDSRTCDLPVFEVNRPCCDRPPFEPGTQRLHIASADPVFASPSADLVDLRKQEVGKNLTFVQSTDYKSFYNGTDPTRWDLIAGKSKKSPNGTVLTQKSEWELQFEAGHVQYTAPVGEVIGLDLFAVDVHPFHIHVNPFQLTLKPVDANEWLSTWFKSGDWQDTLFIPEKKNVGGSFVHARVLMQTDYFTGPSVVHCHRMMHEDQGMMVTVNFTGVEGTRYPPAYGYMTEDTKSLIDLTCYKGLEVKPANFTGTRVGKCAPASPPPSPPTPPPDDTADPVQGSVCDPNDVGTCGSSIVPSSGLICVPSCL
eukprot:scaffold12166_cov49-Phaeocystis_antarctica.AAC.1